MAQIVMIGEGTLRVGLNDIGDVVAIHDDDVELGPAYSTFQVLVVPGTAKEVSALINSQMPEIKLVFRSMAGAGEWTDQRPEEKEVWSDNGTWREIAKRPTCQANIAVKEELANALADTALAGSSKLSLVRAAVTSNVATSKDNQAEIKIATTAEAEKT